MRFLSLILCFLLGGSLYAKDSMTFYIIPPSVRIDYDTPRTMLRSLHQAKKKQEKQTDDSERVFEVGHVIVELNCNDGNDYLLTAVTDMSAAEQDILIYQHWVGFGFAFIGTTGEIQTPSFLERVPLQDRFTHQAPMLALRMLVDRNVCERFFEFFDWFKEERIFLNFGAAFDPLKKTGAGCASFAVAFLRDQKLVPESLLAKWRQKLLIPEELIGGVIDGVDTGREIDPENMHKLPEAKRWARAGEPHRVLEFYDPQNIYDWGMKHLNYARRKESLGRPKPDLPKGFYKDTEFTRWYREQLHPDILVIDLKEAFPNLHPTN